MIHEIIPVGPLQCNCSIFGDETSREAMVVDPGEDIPVILRALAKHQLKVTAIVVTHAHIDHIGGAQQLKAATGAPVYMNQSDAELARHLDMQAAWLGVQTPPQPEIDVNATDGSTLHVGGTEFQVRHTPGHTQGSLCLFAPAEHLLVAGDTLFRDSIGRTDLPGGNDRQILASIHDQLLPLPDDTLVIPGHGPNTTIGRERVANPFLQGL